jgi:hypothetical protein
MSMMEECIAQCIALYFKDNNNGNQIFRLFHKTTECIADALRLSGAVGKSLRHN